MAVTLREGWPPKPGDLLLRRLGPEEDPGSGWTVIGAGTERHCYKIASGHEPLHPRFLVVDRPPLSSEGSGV
jgi:hypothetical protein